VDTGTIVPRGRTAGVLRLVLLALAATGFLAMHGIAATDPLAGHLSPLDAHAVVAPVAPAAADADPAAAPGMSTAPGGGTHDHGHLAACAFILLTLLAGVVLQAFGWGSRATGSIPSASVRPCRGTPRGPPSPIFLSLCVFRL
jgi:hypothetical protein